MKTLYVMRHAKSSWKDTRLTDFQRPLNKRGQRDLLEMGRRLKKRAIQPDRIISSDARRAMDTAVPIVEMLGLDPAVIRPESGLYDATADQILDIVKHLDDRWQRVMLFGHNPGFTDFANLFLPQPIGNLPTAGIVELRFAVPTWRDTDRQQVLFSDLDFPKTSADL